MSPSPNSKAATEAETKAKTVRSAQLTSKTVDRHELITSMAQQHHLILFPGQQTNKQILYMIGLKLNNLYLSSAIDF